MPALKQTTARTPRPASARTPKGTPPQTDLLSRIIAALESLKATDITTIPLAGKASFADSLVIATGTSSRHLASLADTVADALKNTHSLTGREGDGSADWICLDAGDVVVHLFLPASRTTYNLEKLWSHTFTEPNS